MGCSDQLLFLHHYHLWGRTTEFWHHITLHLSDYTWLLYHRFDQTWLNLYLQNDKTVKFRQIRTVLKRFIESRSDRKYPLLCGLFFCDPLSGGLEFFLSLPLEINLRFKIYAVNLQSLTGVSVWMFKGKRSWLVKCHCRSYLYTLFYKLSINLQISPDLRTRRNPCIALLIISRVNHKSAIFAAPKNQ